MGVGLFAAFVFTAPVLAQTDAPATKPHAGMMRYPAVSATQIAFVYAGKIWLAPRQGGMAVPCANPTGSAVFPRFNPDGKTLAFTGNYDGNADVYTIGIEGGNPFRVTHHPGADVLYGWMPEGKLIFGNRDFNGIRSTVRLLSVPATGGMPTPLPIPYGEQAAVSADGKYLAYTPMSVDTRTWKRYRGGWAQDIWLFDLTDKSAKKITDWEGTDTLPMWSGDTIYYLSDNGPEHRLNLWRYATKSGKREQITKFTDYDVKWPSIGGGAIVFQYGSELRLLDIASGQSHAVEIRVPGDKPGIRLRMADAVKNIEGFSISPSGKRVAVEGRGDLWTAPAKDGTPRNMTRTSGAHERDPSWSPDGRWIAYISDATGENEIYLTQSDGKGETKQITKNGKTFRYLRGWSPDSKYLLFSDPTGALYALTAANGEAKLLDTNPTGGAMGGNWSPDSRFIVYNKQSDPRAQQTLWIYDMQGGEKRQVTSGVFNDSSPVFDRKGEYLFFSSNRVFNRPLYDDQGNSWVYNGTQTLVALPLRADIVSPYAPKSDEETFSGEKKDETPKPTTPAPAAKGATVDDGVSGQWNGTASPGPQGDIAVRMTLQSGAGNAITGTIDATGIGSGTLTGTFDPATKDISLTLMVPGLPPLTLRGKVTGGQMTVSGNAQNQTITLTATRAGSSAPPAAADASAPKPDVKAAVKVTIDFDNFESRAFALPVRPGNLGGLGVNSQNQLLFVRSTPEGGSDIKLFDLTDLKREEKMVAPGANGYDLTPDGKKLLVLGGDAPKIQDASAGATGEPVVTAGMNVMIDPPAEWREIFDEAWRIERDFFYDPNMHGVNWKAIHDQYAKMLPDCNSRGDVGFVISEMISELNVGHAYYGGGDIPAEPSVSVGLLGADFALESGAYRIAKIYRGAAWDTDAIGPLSQPGVKVKEGDYLLAVNGVPLDAKQDPWAAFIGMADKNVTLTVSAKPAMDKDARDVVVRLLGSEAPLRYRAWIEKNRAYVDKVTGGKVGYVYVPDTGVNGQNDLVRQLIGQTAKDALIVDERWNGGGQIPTRFIELLNRPVTNYWAIRDGNGVFPWPPDSNYGPKCMLINGSAGSGGDAFPWYFKQAGLGKLIGMRTWGGLIGIGGYPALVDGASVTAPSFAFFKKDGTWGIEGHGVDPDITVIDDPSKMQNGADPQLEAGIKQMIEELKTKTFVLPKRPPYPDKSGMGIPKKDI